MSELNITTQTRTQEYTTYHWNCPRCNTVRVSGHKPEGYGLGLCSTCYDIYQGEQYIDHFRPVIGARVVDITKPDSIHDNEHVKRLWLKDASGNLWLVTSDDVLYVYEVDANGKPK